METCYCCSIITISEVPLRGPSLTLWGPLSMFVKVHTALCMPEHPALKTLDSIGNCQRPVFSLGVSQHMHKITNLWKFVLNWSREKSCERIMEEKTSLSHKLCAFRCLILRPQILNLRSQNQICGKLLLSWKLHYFRGSRFSQWFILSTALHCSLPSKFLC